MAGRSTAPGRGGKRRLNVVPQSFSTLEKIAAGGLEALGIESRAFGQEPSPVDMLSEGEAHTFLHALADRESAVHPFVAARWRHRQHDRLRNALATFVVRALMGRDELEELGRRLRVVREAIPFLRELAVDDALTLERPLTTLTAASLAMTDAEHVETAIGPRADAGAVRDTHWQALMNTQNLLAAAGEHLVTVERYVHRRLNSEAQTQAHDTMIAGARRRLVCDLLEILADVDRKRISNIEPTSPRTLGFLVKVVTQLLHDESGAPWSDERAEASMRKDAPDALRKLQRGENRSEIGERFPSTGARAP